MKMVHEVAGSSVVVGGEHVTPECPIATTAIGNGRNAGFLAVQMLGMTNAELVKRCIAFCKKFAAESSNNNHNLIRENS